MLPSPKDLNIANLEIFKIQSNYFINFHQALQFLGKNKEWFVTLKLCSYRWKKLRQKGFSGEIFIVDRGSQGSRVEVISCQDWLALASYLASYANRQAINILQAYAILGFSPFS